MRPMLALFLFGLALPRNCAGVRSLTSDQSDACEKLAAQLGEKVSSIGQAGYNTSLESYWSNQEEKLQPACIVAPTSDEDVAQVIKIIAPHGRVGDIQFAVRGGGHTPFEGSANIDKGVTIDLSNLDDVNVSNDRETTTVGMGAKWGDIYQRLDEMGLAVAGGRVSSVGVGGLTLGGGLSFFSPRKGFVCDNVIDFEVVLASGRIIHANMRSHRALWVALRGGSNNFGVVTAMKLRTFEQGQIAGGYTYYDFSTTPQQLAAFSEFSSNPGYDEYASLIQTFSYAQSLNTSVVGNGLVYTKPQLDSPAFENFTSIPSLFSTLRITSLKSVTDELDDSSPPHFYEIYRSICFVNNLDVLRAGVDHYQTYTLPRIRSVSGLTVSFIFQPLPSVITMKSEQTGGNSLGLESSQDLVIALFAASWSNEADNDLVISEGTGLLDVLEARARELEVTSRYRYLNYAWSDQDPIEGYGERSRQKLQRTSHRYDPHGVFQQGCPGGFKLF